MKGLISMKVSVDQEGCISCGFCVNECPDIFDFNEEDKSYVLKQPDSSEEEAVRDCAEGCPVSVINVEE